MVKRRIKGYAVKTSEGFIAVNLNVMQSGSYFDSDITNAVLYPSQDVAEVCSNEIRDRYPWVSVKQIIPIIVTFEFKEVST